MLKIRIFLAAMLFFGFAFNEALFAKAKEKEMLRIPRLNLELVIEKTRVIRGESIPFNVKLTNNDNFPAEIYEIAPTNDVLSFTLKEKKSKEVKASLKDPYLNTGGNIPKENVLETFTLNPKQTKELAGDFLRIFGDIAPGDYRVKAHYKSRGGIDVSSDAYSIRVYRSNPIYAHSQWEYDKVTDSNIKTAWINKGKTYRLFYMENNPKNPTVVESSYPVYTLSGFKEVKVSSVNGYMQGLIHLVWREGKILYALELEDSKAKGRAKAIRIPYGNFEMLNPPFTDSEGNLFIFVAVNNLKAKSFSLVLIKLSHDGRDITRQKIATISGKMSKMTKYSLFFDSKSQAFFAVNTGSKIPYLIYDLVGEKLRLDVQAIEGIKGRVADVMIAKQFKPEKGKEAAYVYYLTRDKNKRSDYTGYLFEIGEKDSKWYPTMNVYYPDRLRIAQGVMDSYLRPYYLLGSSGIRQFFKPYFSIDLDEILPPKKEPKALCTYPQLIVSSTLSEKYGVYVRYIKNRNKFAWDFLHEIKE